MADSTDWMLRMPSPGPLLRTMDGLGDPGLPPPEWTLDELLGTSDLSAADAQMPLLASAEKFASYGALPEPDSPTWLAGPPQQGSNSTPSEDSLGEAKQAAKQSTRERNRAAQAKSRARKRERERQVQDQVQELSLSLRNSERHKGMLQRSNWLLSAAVNECVRMQGPTKCFVPSRSLEGWDPRATLDLRAAFKQPLRITPANICSMDYEAFTRIWQEIATAMIPLLPAAEADHSSPEARKIQSLQHELSALAGYIALGNPRHKWRFMTTPYRPHDVPFYSGLVQRMGVSAQQREQLVALFKDMKEQTDKLDAAERHLQTALQHRGPDGPEIASEPGSGYNLADLLIAVQEDRMRVFFDFGAQVWMQVLTPLQVAICATSGYASASSLAPDLMTVVALLTEPAASLPGAGSSGLGPAQPWPGCSCAQCRQLKLHSPPPVCQGFLAGA